LNNERKTLMTELERTTPEIDDQYSTGLSRHNIEQALIAAGKNLHYLPPAELGVLEDFHTSGRLATSQLAELAEISRNDEVLDAGSGIGGTARFLADQYGCKVTTIDLTEEYCETARWLNRLVGLDELISVRQGDVTELPFAGASFDVVISQHVQMNVLNKTRLYQQALRVLVTGGRLAIWDIAAGRSGQLDYPLPWSDEPELSHLASADQLHAVIDAAGFTIVHWKDVTEQAATLMETFLAAPPGLLGLHNFIDNFAEKSNNLTRGLSSGRLRAIQGIARASAAAGTYPVRSRDQAGLGSSTTGATGRAAPSASVAATPLGSPALAPVPHDGEGGGIATSNTANAAAVRTPPTR
jgi:sarcosine/dimethylglycine N-methyltransferase